MINEIKSLLLYSIVIVSASNAMESLNSIDENLSNKKNNTNLQINNMVNLNPLNIDINNTNKSFTKKKRNRSKINKNKKNVNSQNPICVAINNQRIYIEQAMQQKLNSKEFKSLGKKHCEIMQLQSNEEDIIKYKQYYNNVIDFFIEINLKNHKNNEKSTSNINVFDNTLHEIYDKLYGNNSDNITTIQNQFNKKIGLQKNNIFEIIAKLTIVLSDWSKYMNSLRILGSMHFINDNTFPSKWQSASQQLKKIKDIFSIQEINDIINNQNTVNNY